MPKIVKKAAAKPTVTRTLRWLQIGENTPPHWAQAKTVPHPTEDRDITISTDRHTDFVREEPNPEYIPHEDREPGVKLTASQRTPLNRVYKYPKKVREELKKKADGVLKQLSSITGQKITNARLSLEDGRVNYTQVLDLDGSPYPEQRDTTDDTIVELLTELAYEIASAASTKTKPVSLADQSFARDIDNGIAEP